MDQEEMKTLAKRMGETRFGTPRFGGYGWQMVLKLRECVLNTDILKAEWLGSFRYKLNEPDLMKEHTFSECVWWDYDPATEILFLKFREGDNYDGSPLGPKCQWEIKVRPEMCEVLDMIENQARLLANEYAIGMEMEEEEKRRERRVKEIKAELLRGLN